jgi:hypothetical protein
VTAGRRRCRPQRGEDRHVQSKRRAARRRRACRRDYRRHDRLWCRQGRAIVKQFIASYPAVKATADKIAKKYDVERDSGDQTGGWGAWMAATSAWGEIDAVVRPYGFKNFKAWLDDTINIAMAYAFASHGAEMDAGTRSILTGYVAGSYLCPPCPKGAMCKPSLAHVLKALNSNPRTIHAVRGARLVFGIARGSAATVWRAFSSGRVDVGATSSDGFLTIHPVASTFPTLSGNTASAFGDEVVHGGGDKPGGVVKHASSRLFSGSAPMPPSSR